MAVHAQSNCILLTKAEKTSLLGGHFIYRSVGTAGTPESANVVQTITVNNVDVTNDPTKWGYNVHIGSNGIKLRNNETVLSDWTSSGLNFYNPSTGIASATVSATGLNITEGSITLGNNFSVSSTGVLNASGATVSGNITATSLTIGSGANAYNGVAAINISGYDIDIEIYVDAQEVDPDNYTYLIPHMFHNGENIDSEILDKTHYLWYREDVPQTNPPTYTTGAASDGGIRVDRSGTYRVTYEFQDGAVGDSTTVQDRYVYPTEYITDISADSGILIHPKVGTSNSNYLQIDGNGVYIKNPSGVGLASFTATAAQLGRDTAARFVMGANSLQAYDSNNNKYFEVNANGLTFGSTTALSQDYLNNYITDIGSTGIKVHRSNSNYLQIDGDGVYIKKSDDTLLSKFTAAEAQIGLTSSKNILIDSNGIKIRDDSDTLAKFLADGVTIGIDDGSQSYLYEDYHSLQMIDKGGNTYFHISDLRDSDGYITQFFKGNGSKTTFETTLSIYSLIEVKVDETIIENYTQAGKTITLSEAPAYYQVVKIKYQTYPIYAHLAKAFTIGTRYSDYDIGMFSTSIGYDNTALGQASYAEGHQTYSDGFASHSEGQDTTSSGQASHSEGYRTIATGKGAHAEGKGDDDAYGKNEATGNASHVEGNRTKASGSASHAEGSGTIASGDEAHAEGYRCEATGYESHAQNYYTVAQRRSQTAIGEYNQADTTGSISTRGSYAFIIGNGAEFNPSNALTVAWNGNTTIAGTLTQSSDRKLKDHISYLSNDANEFIRSLKPAYFKKDNQPHVGFYAQDVEQSDKWHCMTGEMNGFKTLGYTEIIAPLVAYCQHLEKRIEELEN